MILENIMLAILVASIATYLCRSLGVLFSTKLTVESWLFDWIKCISIGIIVAVISKIIIFPEGILKQTSLYARIISTIVMLLIYYLAKKNILVSVLCSTLFFTLINYYQEFI